jgi:hypothetical protein
MWTDRERSTRKGWFYEEMYYDRPYPSSNGSETPLRKEGEV